MLNPENKRQRPEVAAVGALAPRCNSRTDSLRCLSCLLIVAVSMSMLSAAHAVTSETIARVPRGAVFLFYGDSLTARGDNHDGWIKLLRRKFAEDLRRPDIRLINAGRGGSGASDLLELLQADFPGQPFVAVVGIGINDVARDAGISQSSGPQKYGATLRSILSRLTRSGAKVLVWSPVVFGENERGGNERDDMIDAYVSSAAEAAKAEEVRFVDTRSSFFAHKAVSASNGMKPPQFTSDGLHLNAAGNRLLFELLFAELNAVAEQAPSANPCEKPGG